MTEKKAAVHEPAVKASAVHDLPTTDGSPAPDIASTPALQVKEKVFIVWNAQDLVFVSGPFRTKQDAQIAIDVQEAKASNATSYVAPTLTIEAVSDANPSLQAAAAAVAKAEEKQAAKEERAAVAEEKKHEAEHKS